VRADCVVGADGINSVVRKQVVGDELCFLGTVVILGIVEENHPLVMSASLSVCLPLCPLALVSALF
jgi:2-polyprenyl-6-methoxyphenol hydroxylase-like FAD-dependent oxidoreductase